MEIWRDIEGYEGLYQVSNEGRIKSSERIVKRKNGRNCFVKEKIIKPQEYSIFGHLCFTPCKNGTQKTIPIHKAVATAFLPNPNGYILVHHKNHNPKDNSVENLEWMSKSEHRALHNSENKTKMVYQYTLNNELVKVWNSLSEASKQLEITISGISDCCHNRRKKYEGYKWSITPL